MKIIFIKRYNTSQHSRAEGWIGDYPAKEAKAFIEDGYARKATKADQKDD